MFSKISLGQTSTRCNIGDKTARPRKKGWIGNGVKYSAEYKADVLKLADKFEVSAACEQLGLSTKTVYNWRREDRIKHSVQLGETPEQAVEHLLRETKELHEANYILRKALGDNRTPSARIICMD